MDRLVASLSDEATAFAYVLDVENKLAMLKTRLLATQLDGPSSSAKEHKLPVDLSTEPAPAVSEEQQEDVAKPTKKKGEFLIISPEP
jgi:hypothetical protein